MGPTVPGDVMAAGNLICASPPYLINSREVSRITEVEHVFMTKSWCSMVFCYLLCGFKQCYPSPEKGPGGPL